MADVAPKDGAKTFVFECTIGGNFVARIEDDTAWVFVPKKTLRLGAVSQAKYQNETATLSVLEKEVSLTIDDYTYTGCRNNRALAIWEDAKLRGADFRAVGNEPGWYLEISQTTHILFVSDYGQRRHKFEAQLPSIDQTAHRTTYVAQDAKHTLTVVIEGNTCHDSMSGEVLEAAVFVSMDEREYRGCGRALH